MGVFGLLKEIYQAKFPSKEPEKNVVPSEYPPASIDWTKFEPAGVADARSPCPMLNALCNHHILPHTGKGITKQMAINALMQSLHLDSTTSGLFAIHATNMNPDKASGTFDLHHLSKHGDIEHDVSLSRNDAAFGDNHSFDRDVWKPVIESYGADRTTTFESISRARFSRVKASQLAHEDAGLKWTYGLKELVLSYGESALVLGLMGGAEDGKIPVEYIRVLFEQNRVPYNEGWRKSEREIGQPEMKHMITELIKANEGKGEEAQIVQKGTVSALHDAVQGLLPDMCNVM